MTVRNLDKLFRPSSVAVVGASDDPNKLGHVIMHNLLGAGLAGPVLPVNPRRHSVCGVLAYPTVESLPVVPDLAVLATPASTIPGLVESLAKRGTRAAIVLADHMGAEAETAGRTLQQAMLDAARPHVMRLLGPSSAGLLVPGWSLNASLMHHPGAGRIAFVSQSRAMCAAVVDWAEARGIGFSHVVSVGGCADVDVADVLDVLAIEPEVSTILLYLVSVGDARKFLSAGRAAARTKRVIVIRGGTSPHPDPTESGALPLVSQDLVYDAAFRRAGMLLVHGVEELFDAVETLARVKRPVRGNRLAVVANGRGPALLALDTLQLEGGHPASLAPDTVTHLNRIVHDGWTGENPVSLTATASSEPYAEVIKTVSADPNIDALLVIHAPVELADAVGAARGVIEATTRAPCTVLTSWMGARSATPARELFARAGIPTYDTPASAVRAFMHIVKYQHSQEMLLEMPSSAPAEFTRDRDRARKVLDTALHAGRDRLTETEAKDLLAAYGIPVVRTFFVLDVLSAVQRAREIGFPVALKVLSPDIPQKSDVGGVALDLESEKELADAFAAITRRVLHHRPNAAILGYSVQQMVRRPEATELLIGVVSDPVFGPLIVFGDGGARAAVGNDRAVALPPLNLSLARRLMARTHVFRLLQGFGHVAGVDMDAISLTLMRVSQLIIDVPELQELVIDPLSAGSDGVLVLDASARLCPAGRPNTWRLAIRPYPAELEEVHPLEGGRSLVLRPIRPEDEASHDRFFSMLTAEDRELRFFNPIRELSREQMARLTQIDYDREMAFVAQASPSDPGGETEGVAAGDTLGVVRCVFDADGQDGEFAISVRSDQKGKGLGKILLTKMIGYARDRGARTVTGHVLSENARMLRLARRLGFEAHRGDDPREVQVRLDLRANAVTSTTDE